MCVSEDFSFWPFLSDYFGVIIVFVFVGLFWCFSVSFLLGRAVSACFWHCIWHLPTPDIYLTHSDTILTLPDTLRHHPDTPQTPPYLACMRPEPYPPTCVSSKLCEFIFFHILSFFASFSQHVSMVTNILSKVFTNFCKFGDIVVDREGGMIFSESPPFPFLISQYWPFIFSYYHFFPNLFNFLFLFLSQTWKKFWSRCLK